MAGIPTTNYSLVPTNEAPFQQITVPLGGQSCVINFYTKSTNVAVSPDGTPQPAPPAPPVYQNVNDCYVDLFVDSGAQLIIGGVRVRAGWLIVRDTYLGFLGDLSVLDMSGLGQDPQGVPSILPPLDLRNPAQVAAFPLSLGNRAPANLAGRIPGMGSRWQLTYWAPGTYTPGYQRAV